MSSKVEICNAALQRVGANRITSLTDGTEEAVTCNNIFDMIVEEVLTEVDWSAATRRAELAQTTTTPAFGYDYEYQLPVDPRCLKVISVETVHASDIAYVIEGDKLLTNEITMFIKYIAMLDSPDDYGPYITKVVVARLAAELVYKFTGVQSNRDALMGQYLSVLQQAAAHDGQQGIPDQYYIDELLWDR